MKHFAQIAGAVLPAVLAIACMTGCVSRRELMREQGEPANVFLKADQILGQEKLSEGRKAWSGLWGRTETQSIYLLLLAKDAILETRYHEHHDLLIVCVRGDVIVEIEKERAFLTAPAAVLVPRFHAYKIIPNKADQDFAALLVYSPPYDAEGPKPDVVLVGKR